MSKAVARGIWHPDFPHAPRRWPIYYGWVIVLVGTIGVVCSIPGQTMGVSVFTDILIDRLGLSRMQISIAYLIGTTLSGFLLPYGGSVFDRIGSRKTTVLVSLLLGCVLIYLSFSDYLAVAFRSMIGVSHYSVSFIVILIGFFSLRFTGQGMLPLASQAMLGKWFNERRGLIMSISGIFMSIAFSMTPLFFSWMIDRFGWRGAYWVMAGGLILGVGLISYLFYRDNPEECGLEMDGPLKGTGSKKEHPDKMVVRDFTRAEATHTVAFWIFVSAFAWWALFGTGYAFHVVAIGEELDISKATILYLFFPASVVSMISNFLIGYVSDYVRLKYVLMGMCFGMFGAPLGLLFFDRWFGLALFVIGMGVSGGSFANMSGNVWPRFFGRTHLGSIHGLFASITVIGSGIGPALFTAFKDYSSGFQGMFWMGLVVPVVIFILSFFADNPQRKFLKG